MAAYKWLILALTLATAFGVVNRARQTPQQPGRIRLGRVAVIGTSLLLILMGVFVVAVVIPLQRSTDLVR